MYCSVRWFSGEKKLSHVTDGGSFRSCLVNFQLSLDCCSVVCDMIGVVLGSSSRSAWAAAKRREVDNSLMDNSLMMKRSLATEISFEFFY